MSDYAKLVDHFSDTYPHLVIEMTGPWRKRDGTLEETPWLCNFKHSQQLLRTVHSGSLGETMADALKEGIQYLEEHADDPRVVAYRDAGDAADQEVSPSV